VGGEDRRPPTTQLAEVTHAETKKHLATLKVLPAGFHDHRVDRLHEVDVPAAP